MTRIILLRGLILGSGFWWIFGAAWEGRDPPATLLPFNERSGPIGAPLNYQVRTGIEDSISHKGKMGAPTRTHVPLSLPKQHLLNINTEPQMNAIEMHPSPHGPGVITHIDMSISQAITIPKENPLKDSSLRLPEWVISMAKKLAGTTNYLNRFGIENLPVVERCAAMTNRADIMECILTGFEHVKGAYQDVKELSMIGLRIPYGGNTATKALSRLHTLMARPYIAKLSKKFGIPLTCKLLLIKNPTSDRNRWMCESYLTQITDLPWSNTVSDFRSGSYGHVNITYPRPSRVDRPVQLRTALNAGVDPDDLALSTTISHQERFI